MKIATLIIGAVLLVIIAVIIVFIAKSKDIKSSMLLRFSIIYAIMLAIGLLIIIQIINIQYVEHDKLVALQKVRDNTPDTIKGRRGNILSDDGSLMASSLPIYRLYMDMRVEAFREKDKKTGKTYFETNVDSLSIALAEKFKDKSAAEYKAGFMKAFKAGKAEYRFYEKEVSYLDFQDVKRFPILRRGAIQGGFTYQERVVRMNAFDILAKRTIGDVYGIVEKGGKSGLEKYYDDELKGKYGLKKREKRAGSKVDIILQPAEDGKDIVTTINIKLQEAAELALMEELERDGATYGCAVVMEVATGKIKAIANLSRTKNGQYSEVTNIACGSEIDPGSTFKTVSFLVAMDDGKIDTTTTVSTEDGTHKFADRIMRDWKKGGFGVLTVPEVMYLSSNVGVSVLIDKNYGIKPQRFIDLIHKTGLDTPIDLEIPGHAKVKIKDTDNKFWSKTSLPWMSIGYEVIVPPIHTLMFYNAIANEGKMMKPMFVSEIRGPIDSVRYLEPTVVNERIAKTETIHKMRKILEGVVREGTAKSVRSKLFSIAGKTGTSQIFEKGSNQNAEGHTRHQITFCGYFPADKPMYSCIVYIREPKGVASAGGMCGKVFKQIAERAYILGGGEVPAWAKDSIK